MEIKIEHLKNAYKKLGYKWYTDRPNLTGIRSTLDVPDAFNDFFCITYRVPEMPAGLAVRKQQAWLNQWGFKGANGKVLVEDGQAGKNTAFAVDEYKKSRNQERMNTYANTTNPGVYWLKNYQDNSAMGAAVLKPGQWKDCWTLGYHMPKKYGKEHRALVQIGKVTVYRDSNRDNMYNLDETKTQTDLFGINIHGSGKLVPSSSVGRWSAGCQVFQRWNDKEEVMGICSSYSDVTGNKFTYTLINERDLY